WLLRRPAHADLWSPPFFHPEPNVGAYSDVLLSAGPLYWPWRLLGLSPETSFQLCLFAAVSLNYLALYLFGRRCLGLPPPAAAFAAFLFAFASPRLSHMVHLQLHLHFYTVLCLYALFRLLSDEGPSGPGRRRRWVPLFLFGLVAQLYGSFYLGWLLGLALAVTLAWGLALPGYRARLAAVLRAHGW